jgi:hypothetical protein
MAKKCVVESGASADISIVETEAQETGSRWDYARRLVEPSIRQILTFSPQAVKYLRWVTAMAMQCRRLKIACIMGTPGKGKAAAVQTGTIVIVDGGAGILPPQLELGTWWQTEARPLIDPELPYGSLEDQCQRLDLGRSRSLMRSQKC